MHSYDSRELVVATPKMKRNDTTVRIVMSTGNVCMHHPSIIER